MWRGEIPEYAEHKCHGCDHRVVGCKATCESWAAYEKWKAYERYIKEKEHEKKDVTFGLIRENKERIRKATKRRYK